jgi:hypothetical protein
MNYPEGYVWEYPGFPSITVCYLKTNDFFFSGHVGLPTLAALYFFKEGKMLFVGFSVFTMLFEVMVMVFTRGHFIIDLICGSLIAHYMFRTVGDFIHCIDNSRISLSPRKTSVQDVATEV